MKNLINFCLAKVGLVAIFILLVGCGGISGTGGTKEDLSTDFNNDNAANTMKESIIDIPNDIKLTAVASSGKKDKGIIDDTYAVAIYGSIGLYIKFADFLKMSIEDFLVAILTTKVLASAEPNTIIPINDGSDTTGFKIEDISTDSSEKYKWKLSLYFKNESTPRFIFRFSFVDGKAKGELKAEIKDPLEFTINGLTTTIDRSLFLDIKFDGTIKNKKLDIDIAQDLSPIMSFAQANWANLNILQKAKLDLSQASKTSLRVQYDGVEYGISGSTYSAGQQLKATLTGETSLLDANRSSYTFRAKSIEGAVNGAKMEVALPVDTLSDISNIWVDDSFSEVFRQKILAGFNSNLNKLIDATNDTDTDSTDNVDYSGTTQEEQRIGFQTLYWMLDDKLPIPTLSQHGLVMTATEYNNAETFWGTSVMKSFGFNSLSDLNNAMSSNFPDVTDAIKKGYYYTMMAPAVIAYYQTNSVALTITQLDTIINKSDDSNDNVFRDTFQTLSHFVNPAFFEKDLGLLGTYDGTNFFVFDKTLNTLSLGAKPSSFDALNVLDLSLLEAIKPNDVYNLTVEVK